MADRPRIVLALPDTTECAMMADWLAAEGFEPVSRSSPAATAEEVRARSFDLLIADAAFALRGGLLAQSRARRPLMPAIVIGDSGGVGSNASSSRVVHLGRPVERAILVCTASMIILDGRQIRQSPRKPIDRLTAIVNGVPVYIIDVSNEGLRLDVPVGRHLVPPPYFEVHVPLVGATLAVRRMWTGSWPGQGRPEATRYGVALTRNRAATEEAWRKFVDATPIAVAGDPSTIQLQVDNCSANSSGSCQKPGRSVAAPKRGSGGASARSGGTRSPFADTASGIPPAHRNSRYPSSRHSPGRMERA